MTCATVVESKTYHFIPGWVPHVITCRFCHTREQIWLAPKTRGRKSSTCDACRLKSKPKGA